MESMKSGFIVQMNRGDHFGVIREDETQTEWIFYFDNLSKEQLKEMRVYTTVAFQRDPIYSQFVARNVSVVRSQYRQVV